jgi:hypothetical protein
VTAAATDPRPSQPSYDRNPAPRETPAPGCPPPVCWNSLPPA